MKFSNFVYLFKNKYISRKKRRCMKRKKMSYTKMKNFLRKEYKSGELSKYFYYKLTTFLTNCISCSGFYNFFFITLCNAFSLIKQFLVHLYTHSTPALACYHFFICAVIPQRVEEFSNPLIRNTLFFLQFASQC